jgi:hypothetical protein
MLPWLLWWQQHMACQQLQQVAAQYLLSAACIYKLHEHLAGKAEKLKCTFQESNSSTLKYCHVLI